MPLINFNREATVVSNGQTQYDGYNLPQDKKAIVKKKVDLTNNPSSIEIGLKLGTGSGSQNLTDLLGGTATINGSIFLPIDTAIYLNGGKIDSVTKILDGVQVVERISREPYDLEFEGVFRNPDIISSTLPDFNGQWTFPQDTIDTFVSNVFIPDSVMKIGNTFLNKLGISEIIIKDFNLVTKRGSADVDFRMKAFENVPGTQGLNIS